ncbi:MAG: carbon storage regulator [Gemmatimonadota bacterium]
MLILQRKADEALLIGDDIRIVVLRTDSGGTRLGIEAPAHVTILREEIVDEVRAENVRAAEQVQQLPFAPPAGG